MLFVKYTLLFDTSVWVLFFGQVQLGFSLVKSFAENSVPCFVFYFILFCGGGERVICVFLLFFPLSVLFWNCLLEPLGIDLIVFSVFIFTALFFCSKFNLIGGGEPARF